MPLKNQVNHATYCDDDQMANFKNVDPRWVDVPFDKGRRYTVPWQWGTTGVIVNTKFYSGDPNVIPEMSDVMHLAKSDLSHHR
jgi:spermidine/putrescine transport system substrate-binding protein